MPKENKTIYAILGLLNHDNLTGYDIKKGISAVMGFYWDAGFGQIYSTLKVLKNNGWIKSFPEEGKRGPNRIVYSITEEGRTQLQKWLLLPPAKEYLKYEILLKLFFGKIVPTKEHIKMIREFIVRNELILHTIQGYKNELENASPISPDHPYMLLTVLLGEKVYKAHLEWANEAIHLLENKEQIEDRDLF